MTTRDKYTVVPEPYSRSFPSAGDARFTWEYDDGRARLLSLYQKGKDKQWDAQSRIDWTQDVDPMNPIGLPDEFHPLFGSPMWEAATNHVAPRCASISRRGSSRSSCMASRGRWCARPR